MAIRGVRIVHTERWKSVNLLLDDEIFDDGMKIRYECERVLAEQIPGAELVYWDWDDKH